MTDKAQHDDDGERPIPNEAIGLGDALDVDAMRTNPIPDRRPYEVVVHLTLGGAAMDRFVERITGADDDVLLAIEHVIQDTLALGRFLPDDDPRGVDVTEAEHDGEVLR